MGSMRGRLGRLEDARRASKASEDEREVEKRRASIVHEAERANERRRQEGGEDVFRITESGAVFCTHDGRPVVTWHQTLSEPWYWDYVEMGNPGGLVHDEGAGAFYSPSGEFAFSRDHCRLDKFFAALGAPDRSPDPGRSS